MPDVSEDCLFCRIGAGEIPATVVYETDTVLAFRDIAPQAPVHVVVIPRAAHHPNLIALAAADPGLASEVLAAAGAVAKAEGLTGEGFRVVFNTGAHAGQTVFHVHAHVLGGGPLGALASS